jgi:hypothetical protein
MMALPAVRDCGAQLIDADGLALHEEMQRGFLELTHILAPVLHPVGISSP